LAPDCTEWKIGRLCLGLRESLAFSILGPIPSATGKANDDHYECFGNTGISVPTVRGLLANDDLTGGEVVGFDTTTPNGAIVYVAADGAFQYTPHVGLIGDDSFTYTRADGSRAAVHISIPRAVWFISNDPQAAVDSANRGTLEDPFVSLDVYNASSLPRPGDITIFHSGTYAGSLKLLDRQIVASKADAFLAGSSNRWGDYGTLDLPVSFMFPEEPATVQSASGDAVTLAKDNVLLGININVGPGGYAVKGRNFGRLTMFGVTATGPGAQVDLENGSLHAEYTDLFVSGTSTTGPALRWAVGPMESDIEHGGPLDKLPDCGPELTPASCNISGPDGGVDARLQIGRGNGHRRRQRDFRRYRHRLCRDIAGHQYALGDVCRQRREGRSV